MAAPKVRWISDLESNGLLGYTPYEDKASNVWMFVTFDTKLQKFLVYIQDDCYTEDTKKYLDSYQIGGLADNLLSHHYDSKEFPISHYPLSRLEAHFSKFVSRGLRVCMHNGMKYDRVILRDLLGIEVPWENMLDTLILSQLSDPDRKLHGRPGHGLANWGQYFDIPKPEHEDWNNFSLDMIHRCIQDVIINVLTYHHIDEEISNRAEARQGIVWDEAIELEHKVAMIMSDSELRGFRFNSKAANKYLKRMEDHLASLDEEIGFDKILLSNRHGGPVPSKDFERVFQRVIDKNPDEWSHFFSPEMMEDSEEGAKRRVGYGVPVVNIRTKGGGYTSNILKFFGVKPIEGAKAYSSIELPHIVGPFSRVSLEPVNPNSSSQLSRMLLSRGWSPVEFTPAGSPKITDDSLEEFVKVNPEYSNLRDRIITQARISMLKNSDDDTKGLVNLVREDKCLTGINNSCAAATHRSKHKIIVNIPAVGARWGALFRKLFVSDYSSEPESVLEYTTGKWDVQGNAITETVIKDGKDKEVPVKVSKRVVGKKALVGCDAQALEMRILGHLLNDDALINEIVNGDIHMIFHSTVDDISSSRDNTKSLEYSYLYGAGSPKLGSGCDIGRDIIGEAELLRSKWRKADGGWTDNYRDKKGIPPASFKVAQDAELGKIVGTRFKEGLPALGNLVDGLRAQVKEYGFLRGLDGRRFKSRKAHAALNLKIQSSGAIIMKRALVMAYDECYNKGIPFELRAFIHDEFQVTCEPQLADTLGKILKESIVKAGEYYGLRCPMDGEYKIGINWADTH